MSAIDKENAKLEAAHGSTGGKATYKWEFSENLYFPFRDQEAGWDYVANQQTGIIEARPIFRLRKMVPWCDRQWILCRFQAPPSETQWKNQFGDKVEWPRNGYYAPTNVELDPGINPWDSDGGVTFTDVVIKMGLNDRGKTKQQWDDEGEQIVEKRERDLTQRREDMLDDLLFPYPNSPHIPGKRGGPVSFGGVEGANAPSEPATSGA